MTRIVAVWRVQGLAVVCLLTASLAYTATVNVRAYGAAGNGVTDDTIAVQTAVDAAGTTGGVVNFPSGTYVLSIVQVRPGTTFQTLPGDPRAVILTQSNSTKWVRCFTTTKYPYFGAVDSEPLVFQNLEFDGNLANQGPYQHYELEHQAGIFTTAKINSPGRLTLVVRDCDFRDGVADAIGISDNVLATVSNCTAFNYFRGGITAGSGGTTIDIVDFTSGGATNRAGLQIEVDSPGYNGDWGIHITARNLDLDGGFDLGITPGSTFSGSNILLRRGPCFIFSRDARVRVRDSEFHTGAASRSHIYYPSDAEFENCRFVVEREPGDSVTAFSPTRVYFTLASSGVASNQVCTFRDCTWTSGTNFLQGDVRTAIYINTDDIFRSNRVVVVGGTISQDYERGIHVNQGGHQAISNLAIGASTAIYLGGTSQSGNFYLNTLLNGVTFTEGVTLSEYLAWDSPSNRVTHLNMVVDEAMNTLGTTYGLTDNIYFGGRLILGSNPPAATPGLLGDRYRLKQWIPGQPDQWRCIASHQTAATWVEDANHLPVATSGVHVVRDIATARGRLLAGDPDRDPLTYRIVQGPAHGTVTITDSASGLYTYACSPGYFGTDMFTFQVSDGAEDSNLATQRISRVHRWIFFLCRRQDSATEIRCYGGTTNDGAIFRSAGSFASSSAQNRGNQHSGPHDYSGGPLLDAVLSDGTAISLLKYTLKTYTVWDTATGQAIFSGEWPSYAYDHVAPLPELIGLAGGDIPSGSVVLLDDYNYGDHLDLFERTDFGFIRRFKADLGGKLTDGLTQNVDYYGSAAANRHLACSLSNGVIVIGMTGQTNIWLINPDNGALAKPPMPPGIGLLQGIVALPDGRIGFVGADREVLCYRPVCDGAAAPALGPLHHALQIPATHGSWVTDACAFHDGTIGLLIGCGNYPTGDGVLNGSVNDAIDVVQRWDLAGNYIGACSTAYARCGHIAGNSAMPFDGLRFVGSIFILR